MSGIYVGTSLPLGQHGYLIWVPERHRFVTANHAVFDETYFPARTFQKRVSDFFGTLPATQDADSIHASLRGEPPSRSSAPSSPPSTDQDDAYDSDDELPGLLAESSDSEGENNDHDDVVDDDDFVVLNKKSTTPATAGEANSSSDEHVLRRIRAQSRSTREHYTSESH
jgi:hypothetical protein